MKARDILEIAEMIADRRWRGRDTDSLSLQRYLDARERRAEKEKKDKEKDKKKEEYKGPNTAQLATIFILCFPFLAPAALIVFLKMMLYAQSLSLQLNAPH